MRTLTTIPGVVEQKLRPPGAKVGVTRFAFDNGFTPGSAVRMIEAIEDGLCLHFFDAEHPQRSDPGLYVSLQRLDAELFVKGANHGWSYPWLPIDSTLAAQWLWLCREYHNIDVGYETAVLRLSRGTSFTPDLDPTAGLGFNSWLTGRLSR